MNIYKITKKITQDENGVVSIFVTLIIMIILSIVVIGFSQISRREVRAALDKQLSTQAFYAAESGVNDAYSVISAKGSSATSAATSCNVSTDYVDTNTSSNIIDPGSNTSYTCLLVNLQPTTLTYHPGVGQAVIADLLPANGAVFQTIKIAWDNGAGSTTYNTASSCNSVMPAFSPYGLWSNGSGLCPPVVQVDIVPISGSMSAATLSTNSKSFFLYPNAGGGSHQLGNITNGQVLPALCSTSCQFTLKNLSAGEYYLRLFSIYGSPPTYTYSGTDTAGNPISFQGSEAQLDSTGKSQDVLRRIRVVVSLNPSINGNAIAPTPPNYAIQTNSSLCKRLEIITPNTTFLNIPSPAPADIAGAAATDRLSAGTRTDISSEPVNQHVNSCYPY
jgi:Tfp pilus assembly protein PilX